MKKFFIAALVASSLLVGCNSATSTKTSTQDSVVTESVTDTTTMAQNPDSTVTE